MVAQLSCRNGLMCQANGLRFCLSIGGSLIWAIKTNIKAVADDGNCNCGTGIDAHPVDTHRTRNSCARA